MVAETSSWGRAIAALGFEVKRGIASRQEVANRRTSNGDSSSTAYVTKGDDSPATPAQKRAYTNAMNKAGVATEYRKAILKGIAGDPPTKAGISKALDILFDKDSDLTGDQRVEKLADMAEEASGEKVIPPSDVPTDISDLPTVDEALASGTIGGDE
jgi:hypothetical protein